MLPVVIQQEIEKVLATATGTSRVPLLYTPVGGGSINDTFKITANKGQTFFAKINRLDQYPDMFLRERQGLEYLAKPDVIRVPATLGHIEAGGYQVLLLEWVEGGVKTAQFWKLFGQQVAGLHSCTSNQSGLSFNNYMGTFPQINEPVQPLVSGLDNGSDWSDFFIQRRLEPQIRRAIDHQLMEVSLIPAFARLYKELPAIFGSRAPALLHGDLWSGNFLCDSKEKPVLIDPAVCYGHPAVDLGLTTMFGGFEQPFYESYHYHAPFPSNYRQQWQVANLYPLLIHLNLFGKGYLQDILYTINHY